jgi:hypothetical protein
MARAVAGEGTAAAARKFMTLSTFATGRSKLDPGAALRGSDATFASAVDGLAADAASEKALRRRRPRSGGARHAEVRRAARAGVGLVHRIGLVNGPAMALGRNAPLRPEAVIRRRLSCGPSLTGRD